MLVGSSFLITVCATPHRLNSRLGLARRYRRVFFARASVCTARAGSCSPSPDLPGVLLSHTCRNSRLASPFHLRLPPLPPPVQQLPLFSMQASSMSAGGYAPPAPCKMWCSIERFLHCPVAPFFLHLLCNSSTSDLFFCLIPFSVSLVVCGTRTHTRRFSHLSSARVCVGVRAIVSDRLLAENVPIPSQQRGLGRKANKQTQNKAIHGRF